MTNANPYMTEKTHGTRIIRDFNLEAFGRALAEALNLPVTVDQPGSHYAAVGIDCGDGLQLNLRNGYGAKVAKVELYAWTRESAMLEQHERPKFPSATVDSARDIAAIAKDVRRRVIDPAIPLMAELRAAVAKRSATVDGLKNMIAQLKADFPGLSINHRDNEKSADVYFNNAGCYLIGSIDAEGKLNIQRLSVSTHEQTRAVFALISGVKQEG